MPASTSSATARSGPPRRRRPPKPALGDAVTFCGWRSDTATWYAAADFVALSSDNEGTPLALIEGGRGGPTGGRDGGRWRRRRRQRRRHRACWHPPTDERRLPTRCSGMADDPALRARLGAAAPAAADGFGIERLVDDLERIYNELLASR